MEVPDSSLIQVKQILVPPNLTPADQILILNLHLQSLQKENFTILSTKLDPYEKGVFWVEVRPNDLAQ